MGITIVRDQSAQEEARSGGNNKPAAGAPAPAAGNNCGLATPELIIWLGIIGLILGAAVVGHHWLSAYGDDRYDKGLADKQVEWDKDNEARAAAQRRQDVAVAQSLLAEEKRRLAAETAADDANANAEEARREARRNRTALVVCAQPQPSQPMPVAPVPERAAAAGVREPGADGVGADVSGGAVLTWQFVREYDTAWTGADGKPVSPDPAGQPGAASPGAPSPYTVEDVIDVHVANARRCSEDRRELATVRARLEAAADAIDRGEP